MCMISFKRVFLFFPGKIIHTPSDFCALFVCVTVSISVHELYVCISKKCDGFWLFINFFQQEKACKQEDRLILKLQDLEMDTTLVGVLRRQAIVLLDGGPTSGLGLGVHRDSIPMHTFARFLFISLLDYYPDLAYEVGLRAMRCVPHGIREYHSEYSYAEIYHVNRFPGPPKKKKKRFFRVLPKIERIIFPCTFFFRKFGPP